MHSHSKNFRFVSIGFIRIVKKIGWSFDLTYTLINHQGATEVFLISQYFNNTKAQHFENFRFNSMTLQIFKNLILGSACIGFLFLMLLNIN